MNRKILSKFCLVLFAVIFFGVALVVNSKDVSFVDIQLGKYKFKVPAENSLDKVSLSWLRWVPGLDSSAGETMFTISADEISAAIPGYNRTDGRYIENISGLLSALTPIERESYLNSNWLSDLWNATDSYKQRIVEECGAGCYKVFRKVEYSYSWALLKVAPQPELPMPKKTSDFWVAHCLEAKGTITKNGRHVGCASNIVVDDFLIEFNVSEQNLEQIDLIRDYLAKKITSWRVKEKEEIK